MNPPETYTLKAEFSVTDDFDQARKQAWLESYDSDNEAREDVVGTLETFLDIEIGDKTEWDSVDVEEVTMAVDYDREFNNDE